MKSGTAAFSDFSSSDFAGEVVAEGRRGEARLDVHGGGDVGLGRAVHSGEAGEAVA